MNETGRVRSRSRRLAALAVKVLDPITGWCLHAEARLERFAEGRSWR